MPVHAFISVMPTWAKGKTSLVVVSLEPARLAVAWRRGDRRPVVGDFVQACRDVAGA